MNDLTQNSHIPTAQDINRWFELAKLDYSRLAAQEQALMAKRSEHWSRFFACLLIPSGYAGVVGIHGATLLLALVCFFLTCISLEIKHDEQVLRYDVRKQMRDLAKAWGFSNHDSKYSDQDGSRFWQGYYKRGRLAAFIMAEIIATVVVSLSLGGLLGIGLLLLNTGFIVVTAWCLL